MRVSKSDPPERNARPRRGRASFSVEHLPPDDLELLETLRSWTWIARSLLSGALVSDESRVRLEDARRISSEIARVLAGDEDGEGDAAERSVTVARHRGRIQAVMSWVPCRRSLFVELLATAPWNLLAPGDPPDSRAVRGSGTALIGWLSRLSRSTGRGGRVSLQAENPRARTVYEKLGFAAMRPSDAPLANVPHGKKGWSDSVVRLARGRAGADERAMPWMLLDPDRAAARRPQSSGLRLQAPGEKAPRSAAPSDRRGPA
jgi:hypothetical protein